MTDTTDDAVTLETAMIRFGIRNDLNCTGEPRMTTERQHTLVPCATCGTGDQPKYMVPVGDDWLCPQCAGSQIHTLRTRLSNYERKALVGTLGSEAEADRYLTFINQPSPEPPRPRRKEQP